MRHAKAGLRHKLPQMLDGAMDVLDAVVDEEHLPAPVRLTQNCLTNCVVLLLRHERCDGHTLLRWGVDAAHIADAEQGHVERPRDGRGGHGEDVHRCAHLPQVFLVADAKALLFIDDDEPEIAEAHISGEQSVRADDDVDLAPRQRRHGFLLLCVGTQPGEHVHPQGKGLKALLKRVKVLLREHRRRHKDGCLRSAGHRLERRAHSHLRLAVANIAADEAVHRTLLLHVRLHIMDCLQLIIRLLIGKGALEFPLPRGLSGERRAGVHLALGVEPQQFLREPQRVLLDAPFGVRPLAPAQAGQGGRAARARVPGDAVHLIRGDVQGVARGVCEDEILALRIIKGALNRSPELRDPVLHMDHVVPL